MGTGDFYLFTHCSGENKQKGIKICQDIFIRGCYEAYSITATSFSFSNQATNVK